MTTIWIVEMFFQGKRDRSYRFKSKGEAIDFYESKLSACRFGLIGWSVSYPREVQP